MLKKSLKRLHVIILHKTVDCASYTCSQSGPVFSSELNFKCHLYNMSPAWSEALLSSKKC